MGKELKLTVREEAFCQEMIKNGGNQRNAYLSAGYSNSNGNISIVDQKASRLIKRGKVNSRYNSLKGKVDAKVEKKLTITKEKLVNRLVDNLNMIDEGLMDEEDKLRLRDFTESNIKVVKQLCDMMGWNKQNIDITSGNSSLEKFVCEKMENSQPKK